MSDFVASSPINSDARTRAVGGTEFSWCKAVPSGTGITVLALLLSKRPDIPLLENALHNLQSSHPILRSKLRYPTANSGIYSFVIPSSPHLRVQSLHLPSTAAAASTQNDAFHCILEHELNRNSWVPQSPPPDAETDVLFVSLYEINEERWAAVLRLHTSACDRASAVALLRELLEVMLLGGENEGEIRGEYERKDEVSLGIENLIPSGKASKPFWARGVDVLGYSLNAFRLAHLGFVDAVSPRGSEVVRLRMNVEDTRRLLGGCESRKIKLCGAFAAAALMAARSSKGLPDHQWEKYAVVTLTDCRSILDPPLSSNHLGFYHSAILNTHDVNGREELWELAQKCYTAYANAKNNNKHFTDMGDLNFLMCKAIDNPGLTPSSSLRTAFISVFEDPIIDDSSSMCEKLGVEDYVGCSSVHGVGPTVAIFDTIRDGQLDCACVYPAPLHSRDQMQKLMENMKRIIVDGCANVEGEN